tara:strand:- start:16506 stop:16652 length:147 start_codon:yes stop_codon:yes gene_type:complete
MVQTGANIAFGGLKLGLIKDGYQSNIDDLVAKLDKNPITKQMAIAMVI